MRLSGRARVRTSKTYRDQPPPGSYVLFPQAGQRGVSPSFMANAAHGRQTSHTVFGIAANGDRQMGTWLAPKE